MKFAITNKIRVQWFSSEQPYAVISIVSPHDIHPPLMEGYVDVLRLHFMDIDFGIESLNEYGFFPEHAKKIIDFTEKNKTRVEMFVVHCNAGISRSSGVAAALSKVYDGDDTWVFENYRYCPNMRVYRGILDEAFNRSLICLPDREV